MATKSNKEIRNVVEAALLASEVPLSVRKIQNLFEEDARPESREIQKALKDLETDCEGRGIELCKIGKGYRFQTRELYAPWMRRLRETRPPRYSRALLETLSIIAYRQPVTRGDIESIRGVAVSSDIMRVLLDREWISQIGHRDVPGRPALYGTTSAFLEYFNLRTLSDLPALIEPRDLNEVAAELNITLPQESDVEGARDRDVIDADNASDDGEDGDEGEDDLDARLDERRDKAEAEIAASLEAIDAELATIPKLDKKVIAALTGDDAQDQPADGGKSASDDAANADTDAESAPETEASTSTESETAEEDTDAASDDSTNVAARVAIGVSAHASADISEDGMTDTQTTTVETVTTPPLTGSRNVDGLEAGEPTADGVSTTDDSADPGSLLIDDATVARALHGDPGEFDDALDSVLPAPPVVHTVNSATDSDAEIEQRASEAVEIGDAQAGDSRLDDSDPESEIDGDALDDGSSNR